MNLVIKDIQDDIPWCIMFTDDIVLIGDNLEKLTIGCRLDE
jgi:hypothetical protein